MENLHLIDNILIGFMMGILPNSPPNHAVFLQESEHGDKIYLLPDSVVRDTHPIFTFAVVQTQLRQPVISSQHLGRNDETDYWVRHEKQYYVIDCQYQNLTHIATSRHSASGWQIEILPNELTSYPPLEYDHLMNGNERDGLHYSQLNQQQKQKYRDEHNPIIRAVCVA